MKLGWFSGSSYFKTSQIIFINIKNKVWLLWEILEIHDKS